MQEHRLFDIRAGKIVVVKSDDPVQPMPDPLEQLANKIRMERNDILSGSDWTQVADAPVDQAAWAEYRQALRDIPQQAGFPHDVAWPVKP